MQGIMIKNEVQHKLCIQLIDTLTFIRMLRKWHFLMQRWYCMLCSCSLILYISWQVYCHVDSTNCKGSVFLLKFHWMYMSICNLAPLHYCSYTIPSVLCEQVHYCIVVWLSFIKTDSIFSLYIFHFKAY